ncbi:metallophosphoesterase [Roseivirga sp. UBA838]|uniref:metallophosphoesterase n=1 Tax=Roseivirga sp. UBA838 TaxID=1947393 RepID=UPI00257F2E40|nr:metallophosphoesterase [Roseivirga sp. UBA838]|tara:strand:- start:3261 stop:4511 length:1251 start_codon:yes stop_codon:yes gene_type:complete
MRSNPLAFLLLVVFLAWLDFYAYQATKTLIDSWKPAAKRVVRYIYLAQAIVMLGLVVCLWLIQTGTVSFMFMLSIVFMSYMAKLLAVLFVFFDDIRRVLRWFFEGRKKRYEKRVASGQKMPRSKFLARSAVVVATLPVVTMSFGIVKGAYDYRVRRRRVYLPNLPKAFEGIKIGQLSDIHSGSFFDKTAVEGGIDLLLKEKPDAIFFTGDLVNNETREVAQYVDLFSRLKADLGVFSTLGNHDYGDYKAWSSPMAKARNLQEMIKVHERMGWRLLMNEHEVLRMGTDQLAVIGVENWGAGRFAKYGNLEEAARHAEGDVKLLLSHDPSHWDAQVRTQQPDIDLMFAGHTHGMQLGVEIGDFRWSPSKYIYKQWADLYQEGNQYLYVNRGFGFLGFPGRIGIYPEITILELTSRPLV